MMINRPNPFLIIFCWACIAGASVGVVRVYEFSKQKQAIQYDLAEWKSLKFGLLNEALWNEQVAHFLMQQVADFELTGPNRAIIQKGIESLLYHGVDHIDELIKFPRPGNQYILQQALAALAKDITIDKEVLARQVPSIAIDIVNYMNTPQNKMALKAYIQERIKESVRTSQTKELAINGQLRDRYQCSDRQACIQKLEEQVVSLDQNSQIWGYSAIGLVGLILLISFMFSKMLPLIPITVGSLVLLIGGIAIPMIEIEAIIERLQLNLMGQNIDFTDQVLFYQSKSILEVVELLVRNGDGLTIFVGFLIFLFSVLFPGAKLLLSTWTVKRPNLASNRIISFLIYDAAKWSMADVFVVAIFMAFIGMQRLMASQLEFMDESQAAVNQITTSDGTTLQIGFAFFLGFCLLNLFMGTLIKRKLR